MGFPCRSPGYGLTLVSESTTGVLHSAELFSNASLLREEVRQPHPPGSVREGQPHPLSSERVDGQPHLSSLPEDIGRQTALLLIQEIVRVSHGSIYTLML